MKNNWLKIQQISAVISPFVSFNKHQIPAKGWVFSLRNAFGITLQQLANRLNVSKQSVASLEKREIDGSVTLNTLNQVADCLDLQLVYAFIPKHGTLEDLINQKAKEKAKEIVMRTSVAMKLEDQENSAERLKQAIEERAMDIKLNHIQMIWE